MSVEDVAAPADPEVPTDLKGDQPEAFRIVTERLLSGQRFTKLVGYAGTGKTFLLGRVAKWAVGRGFQVKVTAPTHKAAGVIKEKMDAAGVRGVEVRTVHSLLGLRLEPDLDDDTGGRVLKSGESKVIGGLVICDEASMVGEELKAHVEACSPKVRWLFVGDLAQLPPVGEPVSEVLSDPDACLERVLRQAEGSEILRLATSIRAGEDHLDFRPGRDVTRVDSAEDLFQAALARFKTPEYRADAAHARVLVFRNVRRAAFNERFRAELIDSPDPFAAGEWLVMYRAFAPEKSRLNQLAARAEASGSKRDWKAFWDLKAKVGSEAFQLHVSEEVLIREAKPDRVTVKEWAFDAWRLKVKVRSGGTVELPVLTEAESPRFAQVRGELRAAALTAKEERDLRSARSPEWNEAEGRRREAWADFFKLEETFAEVDRAYAMTTHKAQGSTFDHAFVDVTDLACSGGMFQRILYTAVTRPAKTLTFCA